MEKKRFIAIRNQADTNTLELFFLDVIEEKFDWFDGFTSPVQEIIDKVNFYKPSTIRCIIDSVGGDATKGMAIYNFLKRCDAKVEVEIIGLAASIASVIAMAANKGKLRIAKNAFMMIHKAEGSAWGTADDLRRYADVVEMYTDQIVDIYSQRSGKTIPEIKKMIEDGDYWMSGTDAVDMGFADATFNETPNLQVAARLDPKVYNSLPENIKEKMGLTNGPNASDKNFFQTQFDDMKKFFTDIVNAIKGVTPSTDPKITVTNQIAEAVLAPFEKLGDEIETTITNKVTETVGSKTVNDAIALQVSNSVAAIDFSKDGAPKTALDGAVKVAVENATKDLLPKITALETANGELKKKNEDLETEITAMKGNRTAANPTDNGITPIGSWK